MQDFNPNTSSPDKALEAYSRIRTALNRYCSPPGSFLNIRLVAERLKVSTTPVREALIRLANEEVIGFIRGRGYYTRVLDADELAADHEFAMVMMKFSMEAGAGAPIDGLAMDLSSVWKGERVVEELHATKIVTHVEEYYERIAERSANRKIVRNMAEFCARTGHIRQFGLIFAPTIHKALWSLTELEAALRNGDRSHAVRIGQRHTRLIIEALPDLVRDLNQRAKASKTPLEDLL